MYQNIGGENSAPFKVVERGYTDMFPTQKHMEINNLPFFRLSERLREDRILYQNIGGKIQPPLKLVERGYADLFPTWKHMKINNSPLLRPPERLQED